MRLIVHNFYSKKSASGENNVVSLEKKHSDKTFFVFSDVVLKSKNLLISFFCLWLYQRKTKKRLSRFLRSHNFTTIVIHNTFPVIGDGFIRKIDPNVKVVLRLHNYRNLVTCGILSDKNGNFCDLCVRRKLRLSPLVLLWKCYNGSFSKSILVYLKLLKLVASKSLMRVDEVQYFSNFQKKLVEPLFRKNVIWTQTLNKVSHPNSKKKWINNGKLNRYIFIGRLSAEKGVHLLLKTWDDWDTNIQLDIYGSGPLVDTVKEYSIRTQVNFKGFLYSKEKYDVMSDGSVLLFPSQCIEGHPLLIEEAKVVGMPGLISNIGPLSEYTVGTNLRLIDFTVDDLRNTLSDYHHEISK